MGSASRARGVLPPPAAAARPPTLTTARPRSPPPPPPPPPPPGPPPPQTHTVHHPYLTHVSDPKSEILGAKEWLRDECGIPEADLVGFRCPYLEHDPDVRKVLAKNDFLYDSSIIEHPGFSKSSPSAGNRLWPYTMDYGIAQDCHWCVRGGGGGGRAAQRGRGVEA